MANPRPVSPDHRPGPAPPAGSSAGPDHHAAAASATRDAPAPKSLGAALRAAGMAPGRPRSGSETPSEEDYDENVRPALANADPGVRRRRGGREQQHASPLRPGQSAAFRDGDGVHIVPDDDKSIQDFLHRSARRAREADPARRPGKFTDLVFTRQFSAFDRHSVAAANSPFHGFYTLFWLGVALFVFKISAENWRTYGNPLGPSDIMKTMFHREVFTLLLSDGIMCGLTGVSWGLQKLVFYNWLNWDSSGWIIQHLWQTTFIVGVVGLTLVRDWPWTHTVFFVLHGLVMLMKQHSYASYNGYLSTVHKRRRFLLSKLKQLERFDPAAGPSRTDPPVSSISTSHLSEVPSAAQRRHSLSHLHGSEETDIDRIAHAIASRQPLDDEQIRLFERIVKWEVDALADELRGTASEPARAYPSNLTFTKHYQWIPLPTVVYELEYPTSDSIDWWYVAEKLMAMIGVLFVMVQVSQYSIYPVVMKTVEMKENEVPLLERLQEFPWILADLIFPFMMEYLLVWYLIWETILNILAELTFFADRSFYDAWWNSVSWDQFARDWNRPVHNFLLRHVYHSSISSMKVNKHTATLITFFLSACIHELVMWCLFKKLRGYLLFLQMCQLPLVRLSRTKWLKGRKTLGNLIFWVGIFTGPSLLCSLYLIL